MRKLLIFVFLGLFFTVNYANAAVSKETITKVYNSFYSKIEVKYGKEKQLQVLESIESKLNKVLSSSSLPESKRELLRHLFDLNAQKIEDIKNSSKKSHYVEQKEKELRYIFPLKNLWIGQTLPQYIQELQSQWFEVKYVNDEYEFVDGWKVKKYVFERYYSIDSWNYTAFQDKKWMIIKTSSSKTYIFIEEFEIGEKIPYSSFYTEEYSNKFIEENNKYVLWDDDIYYTYVFDNYSVFSDEYWIYEQNLSTLWVDIEDTIFYRDSTGKFWFVRDYEKVKLISKNILSGVVNTEVFLNVLADDKKWLSDDTDKDFITLKTLSNSLVKNVKTQDEKIEKIYHWILDNISYTKNINLNDRKIFSWIQTYKNKDGVCDGYSKLMVYMLLFAGISDVEQIKWDVFDAKDFPDIGHAWVRVWDTYFDPTFDDPLWLSSTLTRDAYRYFDLPKDLFYTNRYDFWNTPEYLKSLSLEEREKIVRKNIYNLTENLSSSEYNLLLPLEFRKRNKLSYDYEFTLNNISSIFTVYEVNDFAFTMNGKKKNITFLQYYTLDNNQTIETILSQHAYDTSWMYLFKWKMPNGSYEYRIWYDVKF